MKWTVVWTVVIMGFCALYASLEPMTFTFLVCLSMPTAAALSGLYVLIGGNDGEDDMGKKHSANVDRAMQPLKETDASLVEHVTTVVVSTPSSPIVPDTVPVGAGVRMEHPEIPTPGRVVQVPSRSVGRLPLPDMPDHWTVALVIDTDVAAGVFEVIAFGASPYEVLRRVVVDAGRPGTWRWPPRG